MMTNAEFEAKRAREIEDIVAKTMRSMVDLVVEDKRAILTELDRWVSMEEATHLRAIGQEH
jgi:hypothetical protein